MSDREVPFSKDKICDLCGAKGADDFMGDYICPNCSIKFIPCENCGKCECDGKCFDEEE